MGSHLPSRCICSGEYEQKLLQMEGNSSRGRLNLGVISTKAHELIRIVVAAWNKTLEAGKLWDLRAACGYLPGDGDVRSREQLWMQSQEEHQS